MGAAVTRVAIIGGGIGGLTAARALRRRGFEVAIYESAPGAARDRRGRRARSECDEGAAIARARGRGARDRGPRGVGGYAPWKTGRVISRTSRDRQAALFGSAGATAHRADLLDVLTQSLPGDIVTLGARVRRSRVRRRGRGREVPGRQRGRGRRHRRRRRDPLGRARVAVRPRRPALHRQDLLPERDPVDAVPGEPPPVDDVSRGWDLTARSCCTRCDATS